MNTPVQSSLKQHKGLLENHSLLVTNTIQSVRDLRVFMEHHVYAVWDFMSLAKSLQHAVCPSGNLWIPNRLQRTCGRLINEIILSEESDADPFTGGNLSHFDLYCQSMIEIGADTTPIMKFLDIVEHRGVKFALDSAAIPEPSRLFMRSTFDIIDRNQPHEIAAAFTHGRETVIPQMFRRLIQQFNFNRLDCPRMFYYLDRHVGVDENEHGPAAMLLMNELCNSDPIKLMEAEKSAIKAIKSRIEFWDNVEQAICND
jgi:hypothetical protein